MKKNLIKIALFGLVAVFSATFVGCKDYDDDIKNLQTQIDSVKDAVSALQEKVGSGKYVESATPFTDGNGGYEIAFSDGTSIKINNGAKGDKGDQGEQGEKGETGTAIGSKYVVSVDYKEEGAFYVITFTYSNGDKPTVIEIPAAAKTVTGIKFIPTVLSGGEAARMHFPVIITDSIIANKEIGGQLYDDIDGTNIDQFSIVYSGKGEFKYQVNPHNASFDGFDEIYFTRDTAIIWNYSTNDMKWMMFNPGQAFYTNGILTKAEAYAEGKGVLNLRAKDWAFAERSNIKERTVYALAIQNGDNIIYSDFVPAKHEPILQKDVYLVRKNNDADAIVAAAPNTQNYKEYIDDAWYLKSSNPNDYGTFINNIAAVEALQENLDYKAADVTYSVVYNGDGIDLKKDVMSFFRSKARGGVNPGDAEYILEENGFDDYTLEWEIVNFYNDGVNQSARYLTVDQNGWAKVTLNSQWSTPGEGESHTASIGRTPIVRVKLVAPGEDNKNVVKTAIIKLLITEKPVVVEPIVVKYEGTAVLKHIDQELPVDMDKLFNAAGLSKENFRDTYKFVRDADATEANAQTRVKLYDSRYDDNGNETSDEYNKIYALVTNTAFHTDHVVYVLKGHYEPKTQAEGGINPKAENIYIEYTVNVKYPEVEAPKTTYANWLDEGVLARAHGRLSHSTIATSNNYFMVAVMDDLFDLVTYNPYGSGNTVDMARAQLSFELVDIYNEESNVPGSRSGVRLYQEPISAGGEWKLQLQPNDLGRAYINADQDDLDPNKMIKVRAVVSFNECVDGLYGTCTSETDNIHKFAKTAAHGIPCNQINGTWTTGDVHTQTYVDNAGVAPELGRSVVVAEFEVAFVTPMIFKAKEVEDLTDKYSADQNRRTLDHAFQLAYYLYNGRQDEYALQQIVYDYDLRGQGFMDQNTGWASVWETIFKTGANKVHFEVGKVYFQNNPSLEMDAVNKRKVILRDEPDGTTTITWDNSGNNVENAFIIEVEVCVRHTWGQICNHSWNPETGNTNENKLGHSVGIIKVPVETWNGQ